jgi:hypothetical protein
MQTYKHVSKFEMYIFFDMAITSNKLDEKNNNCRDVCILYKALHQNIIYNTEI